MDWATPCSQPRIDAQSRAQLMSQTWPGHDSAPFQRFPLEDESLESTFSVVDTLGVNAVPCETSAVQPYSYGFEQPFISHHWASPGPKVSQIEASSQSQSGSELQSHGANWPTGTDQRDSLQNPVCPQIFGDPKFVHSKSWLSPDCNLGPAPKYLSDLLSQHPIDPVEMENQRDSPSNLKANIKIPSKPSTKVGIDKHHKQRTHQSSLACEFPECRVKFTHKKDRARHLRTKHQLNQGFICPIVECNMGTGHKIQRRDKIRDHLSRKSDNSVAWKCFLPGCSETALGKIGMMDHLGNHDRMARLASQQLLIDYGFISDIYPGSYYDKPPLGYLSCEYMCEIAGCPFGTNSLEGMHMHLGMPHVGPTCPCPMPGCEKIFSDWTSAAGHLAREHDATLRKANDKDLLDQGFWWRSSIFICPVCSTEIKILLNKISCDEKIRAHCKTHSFESLQRVSIELVNAFVLSNRHRLWYPRMPLLEANDAQVFAYLTWPKEDLLEIWSMS